MAKSLSFFSLIPPKFNKVYFSWLIRAALAEFVATGFFVFIGCGSVVTTVGGEQSARRLTIAFAHGIAIGIMVAFIGGLTGGHVNPVVTLAFVVTGRLDVFTGIFYVISQLLGGIAAVGLLKASLDTSAANLGAHSLGIGISVWRGVLIEAILTALLISVVWGTAVDPKGPIAIAPLCIGFAIFVDHIVGIPTTGASMNPARSFAPALWTSRWTNHWVYWVGPIIGSVIAGLVYNYVFLYAHRPLSQGNVNRLEEREENRIENESLSKVHSRDPVQV